MTSSYILEVLGAKVNVTRMEAAFVIIFIVCSGSPAGGDVEGVAEVGRGAPGFPYGPPLSLNLPGFRIDAQGAPPPVVSNVSTVNASYVKHNERYESKFPRIGSCDGISAPHDDFTIVTALFDLKRENWQFFKRRFDIYLHYARHLLNLNVPMVAFVQEDVRDFVLYHRRGKEHITRLITTSVEELEYYRRYYTRIKEVMESEVFKEGHQILFHPEGFSPEYNIVMNSKFHMLFESVAMNYFNTEFFYWMDMGYGHGAVDLYPTSCNWAPRSIMTNDDKITYIQLNNMEWLSGFYDLYKTKIPPFLNGGFFGGSQTAVMRYYLLHKKLFEAFLEESIIDDDQNMAVASYFEDPDLFNLVEGWWYDVFKLFQ